MPKLGMVKRRASDGDTQFGSGLGNTMPGKWTWPLVYKALKRSKGGSNEVKRSRVQAQGGSKRFNVHWRVRARVLRSVKS